MDPNKAPTDDIMARYEIPMPFGTLLGPFEARDGANGLLVRLDGTAVTTKSSYCFLTTVDYKLPGQVAWYHVEVDGKDGIGQWRLHQKSHTKNEWRAIAYCLDQGAFPNREDKPKDHPNIVLIPIGEDYATLTGFVRLPEQSHVRPQHAPKLVDIVVSARNLDKLLAKKPSFACSSSIRKTVWSGAVGVAKANWLDNLLLMVDPVSITRVGRDKARIRLKISAEARENRTDHNIIHEIYLSCGITADRARY